MKLKELLESALQYRSAGEYGGMSGDDYKCEGSRITSLKGSPNRVIGNLYAHDNFLVTLEGGPEYVGGVVFLGHNNLTSLKGAPQFVGLSLNATSNHLTSLEGIHKQINFIGGRLNLIDNPIKSHVLGVLLIDGLKVINFDDKQVEKIINKYLKGNRDVIDCQNELMDAGFDEYAQL